MQDRYDFPAVLHYNSDGRIGIVFPDLPGCVSQADSDTEAVKKATEALELHLYGMEEDGEPVPQPSRLADIELAPCRRTLLVTALMPLVREDMETRATKKTLTIPAWLNRAGEAAGGNFSGLLQKAIKEHLGIDASRRALQPPFVERRASEEQAQDGARMANQAGPAGYLSGEGAMLEASVPDLGEMVRWMLASAPYALPLEPRALRTRLLETMEKLRREFG